MYRSAFIIFLFFCSVSLYAQTAGQFATYNSTRGDGGITDALVNYADGSFAEKRYKNVLDDPSIQGSPYTSNSFSQAPLFYKDDAIGTVFYRYNAFNEEMEVKKTKLDEEAIQSLAKDKNLNIRPNGQKMSFHTFVTAENRTTNGYLIQLVDGEEYDLYKRINVKFTEATASQNSFVKAIPARFSQFTEFYVQKKDVNRIDEVLPKKGKLLKLLDDTKKITTKEYLKDNNLNLKNEADMIKVFEFLNQ